MNGRTALLASALFAAATPLLAKEGVSQFRPGADTFGAGALPAQGWHFSNDLSYGEAFELEWREGQTPDFRYADAQELRNTMRFTYVSDADLWGADVGVRYTIPLIRREAVGTGMSHDNNTGLGDLSIAPVLGWQRGNVHMLASLEFYFPTGQFDEQNPYPSNGANYYSVEPSFALTYLTERVEASVKLAYNMKGKNLDNDYDSANEWRSDFLLGWNAQRWTFGLSGYWIDQVASDWTPEHGDMRDSENDIFAVGPMVRYTTDSGNTFSLEYHRARQAGFGDLDNQLSFKFTTTF